MDSKLLRLPAHPNENQTNGSRAVFWGNSYLTCFDPGFCTVSELICVIHFGATVLFRKTTSDCWRFHQAYGLPVGSSCHHPWNSVYCILLQSLGLFKDWVWSDLSKLMLLRVMLQNIHYLLVIAWIWRRSIFKFTCRFQKYCRNILQLWCLLLPSSVSQISFAKHMRECTRQVRWNRSTHIKEQLWWITSADMSNWHAPARELWTWYRRMFLYYYKDRQRSMSYWPDCRSHEERYCQQISVMVIWQLKQAYVVK